MSTVRLGDWTCPSGNNVEAVYRLLGPGIATVSMGWDFPPPLSAEDEEHYCAVIRPSLMAAIAKLADEHGTALVIST